MTRKIFGATTAIALVLSPINITFAAPAEDAGSFQNGVRPMLLAQAEEKVEEILKPVEEAVPVEGQQAEEQPASEAPSEPAQSAAEEPKPAEAKPAAETDTADQPAKTEEKAAEQPAPAEQPQQNAEQPAQAEQQQNAEQPAQAEQPQQNAEQPASEKPATQDEQPAKAAEQPVPKPTQKPKQQQAEQPAKQQPAKKQQAADKPAPKPSANAPKPKPVTEKNIDKQVEQAKQVQTSVVPENASKADREKLQAAERQRRQNAKERRQELIGAAAIGAVVGALVPALGGKIIEDEGDRFVVERDGRYYVRKDEGALFRGRDANIRYEQMERGYTREIVERPNGVEIITVRDEGGYIVRRVKRLPNDALIVLYDSRDDRPRRYRNYDEELPPLRINIPQEEYIISGRRYDRQRFSEVFLAPPVVQLEERYTLREVRENRRIRDMVRRVDLDTITFATGSAYVDSSQIPYLADIAGGMLDAIDQDPQSIFLIEGHTDAVGSDVSNLTLSDRRAETVARILVDAYGVPPENLVVQGYGEQYLKVPTDGPSVENRRVTVRNIAPLLTTAQQ